MKAAYPVVFTVFEDGYLAFAPDFPLDTHGKDLADAISMVRDAIGITGLSLQDKGISLPKPSCMNAIEHESKDIVSMVDIDFDAYRRQIETRVVRRSISLPGWLNEAAEKAGINVSALVQSALKQELGLLN